VRPRKERAPRKDMPPADGLERYRIEVGHNHDVQPGNIVGAIANEAGLDGKHIGHIKIHDDFSYVDLPEGMPKEVFQDLIKVRVAGRALKITRADAEGKTATAGDKPVTKKASASKTEKRTKLKVKPKSKDKESTIES